MDPGVEAYLDGISSRTRRRDARTMAELMRRATGEEPEMWGTIVGFGQYHYKYSSGRPGDAPAAGFAARKAATTIYVADGVGAHAESLARLGPHTTGVGCIYLKDLSTVDLDVLEAIISTSYTALTAATYTQRAREGGKRKTLGPSRLRPTGETQPTRLSGRRPSRPTPPTRV
jgi:hypothetical protein